MGALTESEIVALGKFRERIQDIPLNWFLSHDQNLVRWLRARELNLDQAEAMMRKNAEWRKESEIDDILSRPVPDFMKRDFPFQVTGYDKDGDIVALIPYGDWDFRSLIESGQKHELVNYINYLIELAYKFLESRSSSDAIYNKVVLILDMENFSIKQVLSRPTIELLLGMLQSLEDNHPECLKRAFMINAAKVFELLWAIAKPLMSMRTLSKVDIIGSNPTAWKEKILGLVTPENIPSRYGGSNTSCPNINVYLDKLSGVDPYKEFNIVLQTNEALPEQDLQPVIIEAGSKFQTEVFVSEPGQVIRWAFKTVDYDIGFSVLNERDEKIVDIPRLDSHKYLQLGTHVPPSDGSYTFIFDNSFSRFTPKTLHFAIVVCKPGEAFE